MRYPKVLHEDIISKAGLTRAKGKFVIQEKYDGSQFRFGIKDGKRWFGSKSVDFTDVRPVDKMFKLAVEKANEAIDTFEKTRGKINSDITFFAEYISKPKHNTLTYDHVPTNHFVLFDVFFNTLNCWGFPEEVIKYAESLNVDYARKFMEISNFPTLDIVNNLLINTSSLGGTTIEGVVIKNYSILVEINGQARPLFYKYVRNEFKELNNKEWNNHPDKQSVANVVTDTVNREAVFRKAVQHLEESGNALGDMKDMKELISSVYDDLEQEYKDAIAEKLYRKFEKDIKNQIVHGLPEYYKEYLFKKMEQTLNK